MRELFIYPSLAFSIWYRTQLAKMEVTSLACTQEDVDYIIEQLALFGPVDTKKMFGCVGIFREGKKFAMIGDDFFRPKVDDGIRADYEAAGTPLATRLLWHAV